MQRDESGLESIFEKDDIPDEVRIAYGEEDDVLEEIADELQNGDADSALERLDELGLGIDDLPL